jgi:hypothetical protein
MLAEAFAENATDDAILAIDIWSNITNLGQQCGAAPFERTTGLPMTKFAYAISILAMTVTAIVAGPPARAADAGTPVEAGKMLYAAGGQRLAVVYKVKADGSPQVILDGKLVTVPVATIVSDNGKATTTLTKSELKAR